MEQIKICPVCDQPIKGIWCRSCHNFVREPQIRKVRTSRYSTLEEPTPRVPRFQRRKVEGEGERTRVSTPPPEEGATPTPAPTLRRPQREGDRGGRKKIVGLVIAALVVVQIISAVFTAVGDMVEERELGVSLGELMEVLGSPEPEPDLPDDALEDGELTITQVLAQYTEACNYQGHLSLTMNEAALIMEGYLNERGYEIGWEREYTSYNWAEDWGLDELVTNFSVSDDLYAYQMETGDSFMVFFDRDTVTGQLHDMHLFMPQGGDWQELTSPLLATIGNGDDQAAADAQQAQQDLTQWAAAPSREETVWEYATMRLSAQLRDGDVQIRFEAAEAEF